MSIRVLLVDDHKIFVKQMQHLFDKEPNIKVIGTAANGKDAIKLTRKLLPDIVVMDISMPKLNGIDATKEIKKGMPHMKVLCLTVHSEKHFVSAMLRAGAAGYVLKDCPFEELTRAISAVYAGKTYISKQIAKYFEDVD